jgi:glycosyltransferase involved in cell wall biosynthesis
MADSMTSKKILFLSPQLPYPPVSGGVIKSWRLVEFLCRHYELSVATLLKNDDVDYVNEFLQKVALKDSFFLPVHIPRTALNLVKSNLLFMPLNLYRNRSSKFKDAVRKMAQHADLIFVDHYEMFQYVPADYNGNVVLHQHNCEYLLWERFATLETNLLKKLALYNQAFWIRSYEKKICRRSDTILAAPNDIEELSRIGADPSKFYQTYHLGDQDLLDLPPLKWEDHEQAILFVGTLTWEANIDGILWFMEEAWPLIRQRYPQAKFYVVGKKPDARLVAAAEKSINVVLTGFVEDLEPYFRKSRVFVSPLRFGSGIKVKVMNALYRGIPTVTTTVGAEGLAVRHGEHLMIQNKGHQMAEDVCRLMEDRQLWERMSANMRELANRLYTWEAVLSEVVRAIEQA